MDENKNIQPNERELEIIAKLVRAMGPRPPFWVQILREIRRLVVAIIEGLGRLGIPTNRGRPPSNRESRPSQERTRRQSLGRPTPRKLN